MSDERVVVTLLMEPVGTAIDPHISSERVTDVINRHTESLRAENARLREAENEAGEQAAENAKLRAELARLREQVKHYHANWRKAENDVDRLREALEKIANMGVIGERVPQGFSTASDIARNALKGSA